MPESGENHFKFVPRSPEEMKREKPLDRKYFQLQLKFAQIVSERTSLPLDQILFTHTNFFRRFGFGTPHETGFVNPEWQRYIKGIDTRWDLDDLTSYTYDFYHHSHPEREQNQGRTFGCFNFDPIDPETGVVVLHFSNKNTSTRSPLSGGELDKRREELRQLFTHVQQTYPYAKIVRSGHRTSCRRFPAADISE